MSGASAESVEAEWLLEPRRLSDSDVVFVHDVELWSFRRRGGENEKGVLETLSLDRIVTSTDCPVIVQSARTSSLFIVALNWLISESS
jgi:hypothetical protein